MRIIQLKRSFVIYVLIFLLSFLIYLKTLAPEISMGDSGELIIGAFTLSIAHPPGYSIWCLIGRLFSFIPIGSPAFRVNLSSATYSALAILFFALILKELKISSLVTVITSLSLTLSSTLWSQSTMSEVYALNTLFVTVCLYLFILFLKTLDMRIFYLLSFIFALSLTNHNTMLLFASVFVLVLTLKFIKMKLSSREWIKILCTGLIFFIIGNTILLYLPIRSYADPEMDWGNPKTFEKFKKHIGREQYGGLKKERLLDIFHYEGNFFQLLKREFTLPFFIIGLFGLFISKRMNPDFFKISLALFIMTGIVFCFLLTGLLNEEQLIEVNVYYIPAFIIFASWFAYGIQFILNRMKLKKFISIIILLIPSLILASHYHENDRSRDYIVYDYGLNLLKSLESKTIILAQGDYEFFSLAYLQKVERRRDDVIVLDLNDDLRLDIYGKPAPDLSQVLKNETRPIFHTLKKRIPPSCQPVPRGLGYLILKKGSKESGDFLNIWKLIFTERSFDKRIFVDYFSQIPLQNYYYFKGEYLLYKDEIQEALAEFGKLEGIGENVKQLYNNLGSALAEKGLYELALKQFEKAVSLDPKYTSAYNNMGIIYLQLGMKMEAEKVFKRSLRVNPHQSEIQKNLDDIYK